MTNEQQQSLIFCLDKVKKHLYNTIWAIKPLLMLLLPAAFAANLHPLLPPPPLPLQLPLPPGRHHLHRRHRGQTCLFSIAKERGNSSSTTSIPTAAPM
jgi:hypothetical protein